MTAATVEARELADELALETDTARKAARHLSAIVDVGVRRHQAARLVEQRRAELALYCQLTGERYGHTPSLARVEARDEVLAELLLLTIA